MISAVSNLDIDPSQAERKNGFFATPAKITRGKSDAAAPEALSYKQSKLVTGLHQLAVNVKALLGRLRESQKRTSLRSGIVANLLMGTNKELKDFVGADLAYLKNACRLAKKESFWDSPLLKTQRLEKKKRRSQIRPQEVKAYAASYKRILHSRSGAATDYVSITDDKDTFWIKYRYFTEKCHFLTVFYF